MLDHGRNQKENQNMHRKKWKWKPNNQNSMGFSRSSAKREIHSNASLPQETRETSNKQPNFTCKATRKRIIEEPQSKQKERTYKNQRRNKWKRNERDYIKIKK